MVSIQQYQSPLGGILLAADEVGLVGLWFEGQKYFANTLPVGHCAQTTPILAEAKRWLDIYFAGLPATAAPGRVKFSTIGVENLADNPLRADYHLR